MVREVVELVHRQHDGAPRISKTARDVFVDRIESFGAVDEKQDDVGLVHCMLNLRPDGAVHRFLRVGHQTAGVDDPEVAAVPRGVAEMPIARRSRSIRHDRFAAADKTIEQCRLADIRPPHDRYSWLAHAASGSVRASTKVLRNANGHWYGCGYRGDRDGIDEESIVIHRFTRQERKVDVPKFLECCAHRRTRQESGGGHARAE